MGWELIGGDPAPGSPDTVGGASAALRRVADFASQARTDLVVQTGAAGIERWKGTAADAFRADVGKLPGDLDTVSTSYQEAARALATFQGVLEGAQADARAALALATQAKADRDAASQRLQSAHSEVDALTVSHLRAQASLLSLEGQQRLSIDPTHRASLNAPISSTRSQVNRLAGDLDSARTAASRYQGQVDDADGRLRDANDRANNIRARLDSAVDTAVATLKQAEKDAHLPSWAQEELHKAAQWVTHNADKIKTVLQVVQMICTVASMVFPVAAPVLMAVSLVCGCLMLATDLIKDANTPGGFSTANLWELGGDVLGIVASAAGLGAMSKAMAASKDFEVVNTSLKASKELEAARGLETASKVAGWGQDFTSIGQGYAENGVQGAILSTTMVVAGHAGANLGGGAIHKVLSDAKGSAAVRSQLSDMSLQLKADDPTPNLVGTPVDGLPNTQGMRSVLASGHQGYVGQALGKDYANALSDPVTSGIADHVNDWGQDRLHAHLQPASPGPEINIDLTPSPYGSSQ